MGLIIKNGIRYFGDNSVELTQAQYDALSQAEKLNGTTYYITDGQNITTASAVTYDNTNSGMTATNVQGAIDEVESTILTVHSKTISVTFDNSGEGRLSDPDINHIIAVEDMMSDSGVYPAYFAYRVRGGGWRIKTLNRSGLGYTSQDLVSMTRTVKIYYLA